MWSTDEQRKTRGTGAEVSGSAASSGVSNDSTVSMGSGCASFLGSLAGAGFAAVRLDAGTKEAAGCIDTETGVGAGAGAGWAALREIDFAPEPPSLPTPSELKVRGFDLVMTGVRVAGMG